MLTSPLSVTPLPPWRILFKLAVLYIKNVPVFHPIAEVQGPEKHLKEGAAKHFLAVASRKQGATTTCTGQLCWATTTAAREVQTGHGEKFLHQKEHATLEQITQTGCGITILGGFQHSHKQSHSWSDLVLAVVLLQGKGWGWVTCRGPSQPIFLVLYLYRSCKQNTDFCSSKKILFVLFSAGLSTLTRCGFFFFHLVITRLMFPWGHFHTPGLSFVRNNDQIRSCHFIPELRALFFLCSTLHLSILNSTAILLFSHSHKLFCR